MKRERLDSTFAVLQPDLSATLVPVTPQIYEELDRKFDGFKGRTLVSCHSFSADWPSWERHPAGDELVCLVAGETTVTVEHDGARQSVRLENPGDYVVVPKGAWHIARTSVPTTLFFVTPGEGTEQRPDRDNVR